MRKPLAWGLAVTVLAATSFLVYLRFYAAHPEGFVLSGTIESRQIEVGSRIGGRISEVLAREGDRVKAGQALVRFETFDLEARRQQAAAAVQQAEAMLSKLRRGFRAEEIAQGEAAAEAAQAQLELLRRGFRPEEIDRTRADREAADAELRNAGAIFERTAHLLESGAVSRQTLDDARTHLERAQARQKAAQKHLELLLSGSRVEEIQAAEKHYAEAMARLQLLRKGSRQEDISAAQAQLEQARANLKAMEAHLAETEVRSPAEAAVEVLDVRPGDLVAPGAPIAVLLEPDQGYVKVYVPESKLGFVHPGDRVKVTVDSFPEQKFSGSIVFVAQQGEFTPRNVQTRDEREHQVFAVRVRVEDAEGALRPGMAADVWVKPLTNDRSVTGHQSLPTRLKKAVTSGR